MRLFFSGILLAAIALTAISSAAQKRPAAIRTAPAAPVFTKVERHEELAKRRKAVAAAMADKSILILFSAEPKLYTNDVDYVYRQENNLYYLTGYKQRGATLVIAKDGAKITEALFMPKRVAAEEVWTGKMYSREQAADLSGMTALVDSSEREAFFKSLKEKTAFVSKDGAVTIPSVAQTLYLLLPESPMDRDGAREYRVESEFAKENPGLKVINAQPMFADLRHIKSKYELRLLQHAIDITTEAQMRSMAVVGSSKWEYEVHAEVEYTFRRRNADSWGYPSIVGCGANATTLHYEESQGAVRKGDLLLMDVGAEYDHYTADVTRTYPVNGKFSKEQAEIYQIVYDAQEAVARAAKPGTTMAELGDIARNVISKGLFKLGLVTSPDSGDSRVWFMHGLGHWLGMNVHDVGRNGVPLRPGMVFTNEPGIYIREDALDNLPNTPQWTAFKTKVRPAFEKYKNVGVRIEDDMLVTPNGVVWMTKDLPRKISDIEAFMAAKPALR